MNNTMTPLIGSGENTPSKPRLRQVLHEKIAYPCANHLRQDVSKGIMTPAIELLNSLGHPFELLEYDHPPNSKDYGVAASLALGIQAQQIYKTLLWQLNTRAVVVAMVAADAQISAKALAKRAGAKRAEMLDARKAESLTGYLIGGISPLGQKREFPFYIDDSMMAFETVYVSGGQRGLEIGIAPSLLVELTGASLGSIKQID